MTVCGISKADGVCVMGKCQYIDKCKMVCGECFEKRICVGKTNEDYIRNCTTEELAEELDRISMNETSVENWLWWLQEVHHDNP